MEIKEIMFMFMQHQITNTTNAKITEVCNSQTYNLRKGIVKYVNKEIQAVRNYQLHNREVFKPTRSPNYHN